MNRLTVKTAIALLLVASCGLTACSDDEEPTKDAGADATQDAAADTADEDAAMDAAEDTSTEDTSPDTASDAAADTSATDASEDTSSTDTGADAEADAAQDTGADTADTTQVAEADTCDVAIDATAGGTWDNQSTTDATDDYDSPVSADNCPSGSVSGKDEVYAVSPTDTTTYEVTVTPAGATFDPFLYVRADCAAEACIDGTVFNGPGQPETLTFDAPGGQTSYIIVDGELGSEGDYSLTVTIQ